jgi:hypothetical protein
MKLAEFMERQGLDDEAMAARIRTKKIRCDRTNVLRWRTGKRRPDWPVINRIAEVTNQTVTGDDWMHLEAA